MVDPYTLGNVKINGVDLSKSNIFLAHYPLLGAPLRRQTVLSNMAHRDVVFDENDYANVDTEVQFVVVANSFDDLTQKRELLFGTIDNPGYVPVKILPDDYVYYMYRKSEVKEALFDSNPMNWTRTYTVTFSRDPFKYLDSVVDIDVTKSGTIVTNPTRFSSLPLVKIYGSGTNSDGVSVANINGAIKLQSIQMYTALDSMLEDAYKQDASIYTNENSRMLLPYFPVLKPGNNTITFDSSITKITISPRWRTL
jgi:phage-related protein